MSTQDRVEAPPQGADLEHEVSRGAVRDLLVSSYTPALGSGRAMRTYGIARALAAHRPLDLLYVPFGAAEPDQAFRSIPGIELHEVRPSRGLARIGAYAKALIGGVPPALARAVSSELVRAAKELAGDPKRGRVIADGPTAAAAMLGLAARRAVVYNAHNLESAFRHELEGTSAREHRMLEKFETRVLSHFAESWMVSDADLAGARRMCESARLRYVPNVVDVSAIRPLQGAGEGSMRALFIASFSYEPNRVALAFLAEQIMPLVWSSLPQARLAVVGPGLEGPLPEDPRIELRGFVDDLRAEYERACCAVVPLLQGGGSPLKLVEALAYGMPVVATPRAAAGLALHDGLDCVIADGAQQFANRLTSVLSDGAHEIGAAARRLAEQRYSIETLAGLLAPS
jgi:glycosyltransferase involved in cell wall biosynthesis